MEGRVFGAFRLLLGLCASFRSSWHLEYVCPGNALPTWSLGFCYIYVWSGKVRLTLEVLTHHQLPTGSPLPKWIVLELRSMPNAQLDRPAQLDRTDNPYRSDRSLKGEIVVWGTSKPPKRLEKHFQGKTLSVLVPLLPPIFS